VEASADGRRKKKRQRASSTPQQTKGPPKQKGLLRTVIAIKERKKGEITMMHRQASKTDDDRNRPTVHLNPTPQPNGQLEAVRRVDCTKQQQRRRCSNAMSSDHDEQDSAVMALLSRIDAKRLWEPSLMRRCFEVIIPLRRLCAAFGRQTRESSWDNCSAWARAVRDHVDFVNVCGALQAAVKGIPRGGPLAPMFVAHCGCARPWCSGRPCDAGWMRPIDSCAYNRLLAWQWAEHDIADLDHQFVFGGFFERELVQCTEADIGRGPLAQDARHRGYSTGGDHERANAEQKTVQKTRGSDARAIEGGTALQKRPSWVDGCCSDDDKDSAYAYDNDGRITAHASASDTMKDAPLLLSCGPRCTVAIGDSDVYAGALATLQQRRLDDMPHPTVDVIQGYAARDAEGIERWMSIVGDPFIVRVRLPSVDASL
jgi:hypothetical protein